jgi:5-formyltetrahydrofolate cyclo-ligase
VTTGAAAVAKAELRARIRAARAQRSDVERAAAADRIQATALGVPQLATASVVAGYLDIPGEPGTGPLLDNLRSRGVTVLLPVQRPDGDLDWAGYDGPSAVRLGPHRIREPTGEHLGVAAITTADVVVVPALAIDAGGNRLGQGGGGYDRALRRTDRGRLVIALVYDDELVAQVPVEAHDVAVQAAVSPGGVSWFVVGE